MTDPRMIRQCPVCRKTVQVSRRSGGFHVFAHRDGIGKPCVMTGHRLSDPAESVSI